MGEADVAVIRFLITTT